MFEHQPTCFAHYADAVDTSPLGANGLLDAGEPDLGPNGGNSL